MNKKLLIIGSNSIHTYNYIDLVKEYFDDILLLTNEKNKSYNIKSFEINFSLGLNIFSSVLKIKQIVDEFNPSIIHIHQANSYAFLSIIALRNSNTPKVLTAWGSDILINSKKNIFLKIMLKYILNNIDTITADSNIVLNTAQEITSKKLNKHNINFGINIEKCKEFKKENIIYSNRLHKPLYNIDKVIISFSKFLEINPEWKLVVAASGSETDNLKELCIDLNITNNVKFIGWVDNKTNFEYYCKSKIYISIPSSDSVSLSLIEAIVSGCIVFVSDLLANHEIINSDIGFIESNKENIDFSKYIDISLSQFEQKRQEIENDFSKIVNKEKYLNIYKVLMEENETN